jgi:hypothetical protein
MVGVIRYRIWLNLMPAGAWRQTKGKRFTSVGNQKWKEATWQYTVNVCKFDLTSVSTPQEACTGFGVRRSGRKVTNAF